MPKQGIKRKQWDKEAMVRAVQAVKNKEMGYQKASQIFQVPKGTIEMYVKDARSVHELVSTSLGRKPALTCEMEKMLAEYCIQMEKKFYGLRRQDVKHMAFQLAIRNGLRHPFSQRTGSAGKKWLRGFLARHPELSVYTPQAISAARVKGFNAESVTQFFDIYKK
ncbi:unnamed protein product [Acanthoscelides obtectus]|uniref:HTH CENPB-type domain-containing protein n=1 Tax=Acanthoscelides obtectus TaxID=200917 RepID=A0A9P0LBR8_ACAOB|nr:unnamed protein product [Acanthoscelides obtectus]CAK1662252.1 hypothetical protein AOBTE_LOCUS23056 [Acanthoscelides obtectus]